MNSVTAPIVVVELAGGIDVLIYDSLEAIEFHLEPQDIDKDDLVCDAEGRSILLSSHRGTVTASLIEDTPTRAADLERALREYLRTREDRLSDDQNCDLKCLIEACVKVNPIIHRPEGLLSLGWTRRPYSH
jgi:hypothetical protein